MALTDRGGTLAAMPPIRQLLLVVALSAACSADPGTDDATEPTTDTSQATTSVSDSDSEAESSEPGPGGYGFDRSDPETGIANIMEAFATDEETAACIHEAWGDVANVPPAELTPELMTFEICGTSIFELMTGDPRFTGSDG